MIKTSHVANQNYPRGAGKGQKNTLIHLKDEKKKTRATALGFSFFFFFFLRRSTGCPDLLFLTQRGTCRMCDDDDDAGEQVVGDSVRFPEFRGDPHLERIWPRVMKASAAEPEKLR